jgi:hypothetical protein
MNLLVAVIWLIAACVPVVNLPPRTVATDASSAVCLPTTEHLISYFDPDRHFCLLYPREFRLGDEAEGRIAFYGPALDQSIEPLRGALVITHGEPAGGRTLRQVADDTMQRELLRAPSAIRESILLSGEPAEVVKGVFSEAPGATWQIFVIHDGLIYRWSLYPVDDQFPQVKPQVAAVWQAAIDSFTFLSK